MFQPSPARSPNERRKTLIYEPGENQYLLQNKTYKVEKKMMSMFKSAIKDKTDKEMRKQRLLDFQKQLSGPLMAIPESPDKINQSQNSIFANCP